MQAQSIEQPTTMDDGNSELRSGFWWEVLGALGEVGGAAEVAPVVLVGAEGEDFLVLGGEVEVGVDDGEDAGLVDQREEAGGEDVDTGEG